MTEARPDNFGNKLRAAREKRGVTLRQIANATKISVSVLEALERNDVKRLPGGIFGRGFVRSYAIEVGLEPEQTIQEFIEQFPDESVTAGHRGSEKAEDHDAVENSRRMATTFLLLILVSLPIAGVILYFEVTRQPVASEIGTPSVAPASVSEAPPLAPAAPVPAAAENAPLERLTVALSASRVCWISATADGRKAIDRLLQAGDHETIEIQRELVLTAGDAGALALTLNGAEARPLGKAGEVVTARLNLSNFKDYLAAR